jgi:hypothetical protein
LQRLNERSSPHDQYGSSNGSIPITPATDEFARTTPGTEPDAVFVDVTELQKLKAELQEARSEVVRMNQELHSTHVAKSTVEHLSQPSDADYGYTGEVTEQTLTQLQNKFNADTRTGYGWGSSDARSFYNGPPQHNFGAIQPQAPTRPPVVQQGYRGRNNYLNEPTHFPLDQSFRGNSNPPSRPPSAFETQPYNQYMGGPPHLYGGGCAPGPIGPGPVGGPMGSRLSPEASEFSAGMMGPSPWNSQVSFFHLSRVDLPLIL